MNRSERRKNLKKTKKESHNPDHSNQESVSKAIENYKLGFEKQQENKLDQAIRYYREAIALQPHFLEAHNNLGNLLRKIGKNDEAESCLKKGLEIDPNNVILNNNLATVYNEKGRIKEAITILKKTIAIDPKYFDAKNNLLFCLIADGRMEDATKFAKDLQKEFPENSEVYNNLGIILFKTNNIEEAIEQYKKAIQLQENHSEAHCNMGIALTVCGSKDAEAHLKKATEYYPGNHKAYNALGNFLVEERRFDEAIKAYRRAIEIRPNFPEALNGIGNTYLRKRKYEKALHAFNECISCDPLHKRVLAYKEISLNELGRKEEALLITNLETDIFLTSIAKDKGNSEDIEVFNNKLATELLAHNSLTREPLHKTTKNGKQTGLLMEGAGIALQSLISKINFKIEEYLKNFSINKNRPHHQSKPIKYYLSIWGTVLENAGHQEPHIHTDGWLSGVYYVRIPKSIENDKENRGCIEFGKPGYDIPYSYKPSTKTILPTSGMLLLFPSHLFHRTIPLKTNETRISVAFDVIPIQFA